MAEIAVSDKVKALLEPVTDSSPAGEDLNIYDGPYEMLSNEMNGQQTNYAHSAEEAAKLIKESKHLQVASWLAVSWLMVDGLSGYRDGLQVISGILGAFGNSIYPTKPKRRTAAFRYLARDNWVATLVKCIEEEPLPDKAGLVKEIVDLLEEAADTYAKELGEERPDISVLLDGIKAANITKNGASAANARPVKENGDQKIADNGESHVDGTDASERKFAETSVAQWEDVEPDGNREDEPAIEGEDGAGLGTGVGAGADENRPDESGPDESGPDKIGPDESGPDESGPDESGPDKIGPDKSGQPPLSIPDEVEELLEEISFSAKTGIDIEREATDEDSRVYEQLKSELRNFSGNDYNKCVELSTDILQHRSKHLRVALFLCISWYRTEGITGLKNGFILLDQLLQKFAEEVHPQDNIKRTKIVQRLNSEPRLQKLSDTPIGDEKAEFVVTSEGIKALSDINKQLEFALHDLKGQTYTGVDAFIERIDEVVGDKATKEQKDGFVPHFQISKSGKEKIEYRVDESAIAALEKAGLPGDMVSALWSLAGNDYKGWVRCFDAISLSIGEEAASEYQDVLMAFFNKNVIELQLTERAFVGLVETCKATIDEEYTWLETLSETIVDLAVRARDIVSHAGDELAAIKEKKLRNVQQKERSKERKAARDSSKKTSASSTEGASSTGGPMLIKDVKVTSAEDADRLLKKVLKFYVEPPEDDEATEKTVVPLDARFYGLSRTFKWGHLMVQPADGVIKAPSKDIQNYYVNPPANLGAKEYIRKFELIFLNNDEFLFWLDGQRTVVQALEKLGEEGEPAAFEIKVQLARLLEKFPELPMLTYSDKKTSFASQETREWLDEEVIGQFGGSGAEKILPPILGEDYEEINAVYEKACEALPNEFRENAALMQQAIDQETRQRGKFLIRLNLANFYALGNQPDIARAKFNMLLKDIDTYTITEWESALCVSMWQSAFVNNARLLSTELTPIKREEIEKQQTELFELIARYDGVLAHKLIEYTQE